MRVLGGVDRALRVGADDQELRVPLLQVAPRARDRAARADGDHDRVELAAGLLPDLRARRLVVRLRVRHVRVLVGLVAARDLLGEPVGDGVVALRRVVLDGGRGDHDLGAVRAQHRDLLLAHLVGHDEDAAVALERRGDREADAGVAGGRLDDRAARLELPVALGRLDHRHPDPVLDRAAGVEVLELCEQRRLHVAGDRWRRTMGVSPTRSSRVGYSRAMTRASLPPAQSAERSFCGASSSRSTTRRRTSEKHAERLRPPACRARRVAAAPRCDHGGDGRAAVRARDAGGGRQPAAPSYCALAHGQVLLERHVSEAELLTLALSPGARAAHTRRVRGDAIRPQGGRGRDVRVGGGRRRAAGSRPSDPEIFDIAAAAAARCFFSKTLDALGVQPDAEYLDARPGLREALVTGRPIDDPH